MVKGEPVADMGVETLDGVRRRLRDYRRRSHVLLLVDGPERREAQEARAREESGRWIWLSTVLVRPEAPGLPAGNHLISRWGDLIASYPPGAWDLKRIEDDLLHWEAQDCCDLRQAP